MSFLTLFDDDGFSPAFDVATLFTGGIAGYVLDPSDPAFLAQNSAGSTPVTAPTQPVGYIADQSGNGNHFTQSSDASRPTWQQDAGGFYYLDSNGTGQNMTRTVTVPAGVRKATAWFAIRIDNGNKGWVFHTRLGTAGGLGAYVNSGLYHKVGGGEVSSALAVNTTRIVCVQYDNTTTTFGSNIRVRVDGVAASLTNIAGNTIGDFAADLHRILIAFGTAENLDGRLYGLIVRYAESTADELAAGEQWLSDRCGVAL